MHAIAVHVHVVVTPLTNDMNYYSSSCLCVFILASYPCNNSSLLALFHFQTIARLEQKLVQCKQDMQTGSRDMDTVTADIQATTEEITALKRKHVNRFYYF